MFRRHHQGKIEYLLLELLHDAENTLELTRSCSSAIHFYAMDGQTHINRGVIYLGQGKLDLALADLNRAIAFDGNNPQSYTYRGLIHQEKGEVNQAICDHTKTIMIAECIDRYIKSMDIDECLPYELKMIDWNVAFTYTARGACYAAQGKIPEAIADFSKALKLTPHHDGSRIKLQKILYHHRDFSAVSKLGLFKAIKRLPNHEKKPLLENCLYEGNPLGDRIWKTEFPYTGCGYGKGTLKKIIDHLKTIDPNFVLKIGFRTPNCTLDLVDTPQNPMPENSIVNDLQYKL